MLMNFHFWNKVNKEKIRSYQAVSNCSCVHKHYKYPQRRCRKPCPCVGSSGQRKKSQLRDSKLEDPRDPETIQETAVQIQCERQCQSMKLVCSLQNAMQVYPNYQLYNGGSKGKDTKKTTNECPQLMKCSFTKHPIKGQLDMVQTRYENLQRKGSLEQPGCG